MKVKYTVRSVEKGHALAEVFQLSADQCHSCSGSFFDRSVERTILWRWDHMEVRLGRDGVCIATITTIAVVAVIVVRWRHIVGIFVHFQDELAIFNIDVVFLEGRVPEIMCDVNTFNPSFRVKGVKVIAVVQLEIV